MSFRVLEAIDDRILEDATILHAELTYRRPSRLSRSFLQEKGSDYLVVSDILNHQGEISEAIPHTLGP
jgi:hypothetical protein